MSFFSERIRACWWIYRKRVIDEHQITNLLCSCSRSFMNQSPNFVCKNMPWIIVHRSCSTKCVKERLRGSARSGRARPPDRARNERRNWSERSFRPMASGLFARSGEVPNYDSGDFARPGAQRNWGGSKIPPDRAGSPNWWTT